MSWVLWGKQIAKSNGKTIPEHLLACIGLTQKGKSISNVMPIILGVYHVWESSKKHIVQQFHCSKILIKLRGKTRKKHSFPLLSSYNFESFSKLKTIPESSLIWVVMEVEIETAEMPNSWNNRKQKCLIRKWDALGLKIYLPFALLSPSLFAIERTLHIAVSNCTLKFGKTSK